MTPGRGDPASRAWWPPGESLSLSRLIPSSAKCQLQRAGGQGCPGAQGGSQVCGAGSGPGACPASWRGLQDGVSPPAAPEPPHPSPLRWSSPPGRERAWRMVGASVSPGPRGPAPGPGAHQREWVQELFDPGTSCRRGFHVPGVEEQSSLGARGAGQAGPDSQADGNHGGDPATAPEATKAEGRGGGGQNSPTFRGASCGPGGRGWWQGRGGSLAGAVLR